MTELFLYENPSEPAFPFENVLPKLSWLPEFLVKHITTRIVEGNPANMAPILDTMLVFARARTSALHGIQHWDLCQKLSSRLNLSLSPKDASHHRIELVRRGAQFFITCTRSPRFKWSSKLTDIDIGRNLDYFAPSHLPDPPCPPRGAILFIENTLLRPIHSEFVLLSPRESTVVTNEMQVFNDTRQRLYNDAMYKLQLPYHFTWILNTTAIREAVMIVMTDPQVIPSVEWWHTNCYFVNGFGFPEIVQEPWPFCTPESLFKPWWPLIQTTFQFMLTCKRTEFWFASGTTSFEYWNTMDKLFGRIKSTTLSNPSIEERRTLIEKFKSELEALALLATSPPLKGQSPAVYYVPDG